MTDERLETQFRNPEGDGGRTVLEGMNDHHAPLWELCLSHLPGDLQGDILDIGCGGGGFLRRLSIGYPDSGLFGIDISDDALDMTAEVNAPLVQSGRLGLRRASVEDIPFDDGRFAMVTAMETYFFWPDLRRGLSEAVRVLAPGGVLAVASEVSYSSRDRAEVEALCERYGMTIVEDDALLGIMGSLGLRAECHLGGPGVVYLGVKGRVGTRCGGSAPASTSTSRGPRPWDARRPRCRTA